MLYYYTEKLFLYPSREAEIQAGKKRLRHKFRIWEEYILIIVKLMFQPTFYTLTLKICFPHIFLKKIVSSWNFIQVLVSTYCMTLYHWFLILCCTKAYRVFETGPTSDKPVVGTFWDRATKNGYNIGRCLFSAKIVKSTWVLADNRCII